MKDAKNKMQILEEELVPFVMKLKKTYLIYEVNTKIIDKLFHQELANCYKQYPNISIALMISKIKKSFIEKLNNYTIKLLKNNPQILNNYLNKNLLVQDNLHDNLNQLKKFEKYFTYLNYYPNIDEMMGIIQKNEILNELLSKIIEPFISNNSTDESCVQLNKITNNEKLNNILECYCILKNIDIEDMEMINEDFSEKSLNSIKLYYDSLNKKVLSAQEEKELALKIASSEGSQKQAYINEFLEHNLRLVLPFAKKYAYDDNLYLDTIQQGNIGLIDAINHYDVSKKVKFSVYAKWWIKQSIIKYHKETSRAIRLPNHMWNKINKYNKTKEELESKFNKNITDEEIAESLNWNKELIATIRNHKGDSYSLNIPMNKVTSYFDDSEIELIDSIVDPNVEVEKEAIDKTSYDSIMKIFDLAKLTDLERKILLYRNGFYGYYDMTLDEVAKVIGIKHHQEVSLIEQRALTKLRNSNSIFLLLDYTNNPIAAEEYIYDCRNKDNQKKLNKKLIYQQKKQVKKAN